MLLVVAVSGLIGLLWLTQVLVRSQMNSADLEAQDDAPSTRA